MNKKIRSAIKRVAYNGYLNWMPDGMYLQLLYWAQMNRKLNLKKPTLYNEKLQWIKINDHNPRYTLLVDKYEAKSIVGEEIGKDYIIPTLGIWNRFDDIDFSELPDSFVLKCTHDSGNVIVCEDKSKLDLEQAKKTIDYSIGRNYYLEGREWPYKNVVPRIIAEQYIGEKGHLPEDYKIFTFNGEIDSIMVCKGRELGHPFFYFYDTDWNRLYYQFDNLEKEDNIEKPSNLEQMIEIAKLLSKGTRHLRVDLYSINGKIYFGELTFFNQSGFDLDITLETDKNWGEKIKL